MGQKKRQDIHNSDIPLVCQACEARHGGVCSALTPKQLGDLAKFTQRTAHDSGTELLAAEDQQHTYSNILSGVIKLTKLMSDGRQQIVGLQFAPDFLGRPFSSQQGVTAEAATNVRVCTFPKSVLEKMMKEVPEMEHLLHNQTLKELDEAREWMVTLGRKTAAEKIASFLLLIATHSDPENHTSSEPVRIELPLNRADIADFLGLTIETVSRQITHLRKRGLINIPDRKHIDILDLDALAETAGTYRSE